MYSTIFNTRPKKENKIQFCQRITSLLDEIDFYDNGLTYSDGQRMLNHMFKYSKLNRGFFSIDDLLNEADKPYTSIFKLNKMNNGMIDEDDILVNIDIIINCLYSYKYSLNAHFCDEDRANETIGIVYDAITEYLLSSGLKLYSDESKEEVFIVKNTTKIDLDSVNDKLLKNDVISYYDYRNANNVDAKKRIILSLIGKLEGRKNEISGVMGSRIAETLTNYTNNFNLRHDNTKQSYKSHYNPKIASLTEVELMQWWDYIFAFLLNIYLSLDNLKDVNINDGYK